MIIEFSYQQQLWHYCYNLNTAWNYLRRLRCDFSLYEKEIINGKIPKDYWITETIHLLLDEPLYNLKVKELENNLTLYREALSKAKRYLILE